MRSAIVTTALVALMALTGLSHAAGGSPAPKSPDDTAEAAYNAGLRARDRADALLRKAGETSVAAERERLIAKAQKAYGQGVRQYRKAIDAKPRMYQAHASLGYALRKLGDYEASLAAYDRALAIKPDYAEAVEYRGEAYLALGRLAEARDAYQALTETDAARANQLLLAMRVWVTEQRATAGNGSGNLDEFARWVDERVASAGKSAQATAPMGDW